MSATSTKKSIIAYAACAILATVLLACGGSSETSSDVTSIPSAGATSVPSEVPEPVATEVAATQVPDPTVEIGPMHSSDIDAALIEEAIVEGAASPLEGLPGRDRLATALLNEQLRSAGVDLTGMVLTIYPAATVPSFLLFETTDTTPLLGIESGEVDQLASEQFFTELFASSVLADFEVEKLIMQHSGSDEVGPFVLTILVRLDDLQLAIDGAEVLDRFAVQMERP